MTAPARPPEDADSTRASDANRTPPVGPGALGGMRQSSSPSTAPAAQHQPQPGDRLGAYRVIRELGRGGMGVVYAAVDDTLDRTVALKVLRDTANDATFRERFLRECRAVAGIKSDRIVTVYFAGEEAGVLFMAMEYIDGPTLEAWLTGRFEPVAAREVLWVARDLLTGLAAAHAKDLIHRDIKPGNLMVEPDTGRVKVLDFGLVREVVRSSDAPGDQVTVTQGVFGTPAYMSPEQALAESLDARTDLFSAGTVLYRMVFGRSPFARETAYATAIAVSTVNPPPLTELPAPLCEFIARLMAPKREDRPADASAALAELRVVEQQLAAPAPPSLPAPPPLPAPLSLPEPVFEEAAAPPVKRNRTPALLAAAAVLLLVVIVVLVVRGTGTKEVAQSGNDPVPPPVQPPAVVQPQRRPLPTAQVLSLIRQDIDAHPGPKVTVAQPGRLYLFAPHLASGSSLPEPDRVAYRAALDALATHLKPGGQLLRPLDPDRTLFAVEPPDGFRWPDALLTGYPYSLTFDQTHTIRREDAFVRKHTSLVAYVRADWFVRFADRRLTTGEKLYGVAAPPPPAVRAWAAAWAAGRIDLATASDEIGADPDDTRLAIRTHAPLTDAFRLGPLVEGKTVERAVWESREFAVSGFQELARELNAGTPVLTE